MTLPAEIESQLEKMQASESLQGLDAALTPFLNKSSAEVEAQLNPVQRAQMYQTLAQASAALFTLYLKTKGIDTSDHSFNKEFKRLEQYNKKVRKAAALEELEKSRQSLELDLQAMTKFIAGAVPVSQPQHPKSEPMEKKQTKKKKREQVYVEDDEGKKEEDEEEEIVVRAKPLVVASNTMTQSVVQQQVQIVPKEMEEKKKVKKKKKIKKSVATDNALSFVHDALAEVKGK